MTGPVLHASPPAHLLQTTAETTLGPGNKSVSVFNVMLSEAFSDAQCTSVVAAIKKFYDDMKAYAPASQVWTIGSKVLTWSGDGTSPPTVRTTAPVLSASGLGSTALPFQIACVFSWRTAISSRWTRGRTYYGPLGSNVLTGPVFTTTFQTGAQAAGAGLITSLQAITGAGGGHADLAVWSKTHDQVTAIGSVSIDPTPDTMRTRVH